MHEIIPQVMSVMFPRQETEGKASNTSKNDLLT
jgi:hypothetical protein